jgi:hypothetical protein
MGPRGMMRSRFIRNVGNITAYAHVKTHGQQAIFFIPIRILPDLLNSDEADHHFRRFSMVMELFDKTKLPTTVEFQTNWKYAGAIRSAPVTTQDQRSHLICHHIPPEFPHLIRLWDCNAADAICL